MRAGIEELAGMTGTTGLGKGGGGGGAAFEELRATGGAPEPVKYEPSIYGLRQHKRRQCKT